MHGRNNAWIFSQQQRYITTTTTTSFFLYNDNDDNNNNNNDDDNIGETADDDLSERKIEIRSFPIQYSTRNTVLVGMCS